MTEARKKGPRGLVRKTLDFLSIFTRSKRGALGIAVLVFFIAFAFIGPVIAPYDPIRDIVGARIVPPAWYSYFTPGLSQNIEAISDPQFNSPASVNPWKTNTSLISLSHSADTGIAGPPGSLKMTYTRGSSAPTAGTIGAEAWVDFHYPYDGPALGVRGSFALRATGVSSTDTVTVRPFLEEVGRIKYYFTTQPVMFRSNPAQGVWRAPVIQIDSGKLEFETQVLGFEGTPGIVVAEKLFRKTADYRYGIEVQIRDVTPGIERNVQVFLDDFPLILQGSSWGLLGTGNIGIDLFSQLSHGARLSLIVGLSAAILSIVIGLFAGLMAGYLGKFADELIMRFTDMLLVLPGLPLLLVVIAVLGASLWNIILLISLLGWMGFARTVRSQVLSVKERPYIEASRAVGAGTFHITLRHVFPNIIGLTYVSLALAVPGAIIAEAALSWLGLGDPLLPSWGKILYNWQLTGAPTYALWWVIPPGICIAAVSLSFVLIGYALDEILNPKLRQRR